MATSDDNWIRIAHLVRPQGRHGEVLAELFTDFPERFAQQPSVFLAKPKPASQAASISKAASVPQTAVIERHWLHKGRVVLKFQGVNSITEAEALRGLDVVIEREARLPLTDGAIYIDELIGCALVDASQPDAPVVGTIRDVLPQSEMADLLVVTGTITGADGNRKSIEHLIPFAKAYLISTDVAARRITMKIPAGLLAVNAPLTPEEEQAAAQEEAD